MYSHAKVHLTVYFVKKMTLLLDFKDIGKLLKGVTQQVLLSEPRMHLYKIENILISLNTSFPLHQFCLHKVVIKLLSDKINLSTIADTITISW